MAAAVITKILRGFLRNLPKGEANELARIQGMLKKGNIDVDRWEKEGFSGISEYMEAVGRRERTPTERFVTSQQAQKRLQSELEERLDLDIVDVKKETVKETTTRVKEINELRKVGVAQERLNRFAGREFWKGESGETLPITDKQLIERGYEKIGVRIPSAVTRDEFGRPLPEFKEWGPEHVREFHVLKEQEKNKILSGLMREEDRLSDVQLQEIVTNKIAETSPLHWRMRQHTPYPGAFPQLIPESVPPTKGEVLTRMRGEETGFGTTKQAYEEVVGEDIAKSLGVSEADIPSLQDVISVGPEQEKVLSRMFGKDISGIPPREARPHENTLARMLQLKRQQAEREQFSAGRSAALRGRLLGQGRRDETFAYGVPEEGRLPRDVRLDLPLEVPSITDPKIIATLRKEASDLRYKRNRFRQQISEEVQKNPYRENAHEKAWEKIKSTKAYQKYVQDKIKLQREINTKAPNLMEADPFEATRETIRPKRKPSLRLGVAGESSEQYMDRVLSEVGKIKRPTKKLVDSFKKGRKIVNRKRGGLIKKPRGWGAARYKTG